MIAVTEDFLGLGGTVCLFWDFAGLDASLSPQSQADILKEDLAQVQISASELLDVILHSTSMGILSC
ncbi:MAG: hypothetical protein ACI9OJ_002317 [Myxococcota bacterium]